MQRAFSIRHLLPRLYGRSAPSCSSFSAEATRCLGAAGYRSGGGGRQREHRHRWQSSGGEHSDRRRPPFPRVGPALLAVSFWGAFKDLVGYETIKLDDDPLKAKIKQSWLLRKHGKRKEAAVVLHEALHEAQQAKDEMAITRICDELAGTYYELGQLDEADKLFREVLSRLMQLHNTKERDPDFIGISLKLADIFAQKGDIRSAEIGFRHCVSKQQEVVQEHLKKYLVSHGAYMEAAGDPETSLGVEYSDPIALFGMCLEAFAHFLVNYCGDDRLEESQKYIDEAIKIGHQLFGPLNAHTANLLNNYGAACLWKHKFTVAIKYLEEGAKKALHIAECEKLLPGYYCNYAEALFHSGKEDQSLNIAKRAVELAKKNKDPKVLDYAQRFLKDLERDYNKKMGKRSSWW
uniref:Uncharacterized protein n=1 Tax=Plectus sambesii TaxID=2011161 RepID=A0A914XE02_9BILA